MGNVRVRTGNHFQMGNWACAEGALAAGCDFAAGYPITPASEVANYLARRLPEADGVFLQTEDEISACCAAVGAAWAGRRAMTVPDHRAGSGHAAGHVRRDDPRLRPCGTLPRAGLRHG